MPSSIFFEFHLPNSPTWFYFSLFLTVALFFQFNRVFSLRNWDLVAMFLFVPGSLLVLEANQLAVLDPAAADRAARTRLIGYGWLLVASAYWFARCLFDLAATRRPLVSPNLTTPALAWFGGALFLCFVAVAYTRPGDPWGPVGKPPVVLTGVQAGAAAMVSPDVGVGEPATSETRFWVERSFAMLCHAAVVTGLVLIGARQFQDLATGVTAGALYLLIPYTAFHVGQVHHVWPAALVVWAVYFYRHAFAAGALIGLAAGTIFFPALLVPAWVQFYRGRGLARFLTGFAVTGVLSLGVTLAALHAAGEFPHGVWRTLNLSDWHPWSAPTAESIWQGIHWAYRLPAFVLYVGFVLTLVAWPPVRNLGQLIAALAAALIGIQFWFADRGGLYVLWYAPLVVLLVVRPSLTDAEPAAPRPLPAFVRWAGRWVRDRVWAPRPADAPDLAARQVTPPRLLPADL